MITVGNSLGALIVLERTPGATSWLVRTAVYGIFGPSSVAATATHAGPYYKAYFVAASGGTLYDWGGWVGDSAAPWVQVSVAVPGPAGSFTGGSVVVNANNSDELIAAATTTGGIDVWANAVQEVVAAGGTGVTYASPQVAFTPTFRIGLRSYFYLVASPALRSSSPPLIASRATSSTGTRRTPPIHGTSSW